MISEISSKSTKTLGFLRSNLAFAPKSTKEVAYKTLFYLNWNMQHPLGAQIEKGWQPAGPAGDGETQVVSTKCLMNLSDHLLSPSGTSPLYFSFIRFTVVLLGSAVAQS